MYIVVLVSFAADSLAADSFTADSFDASCFKSFFSTFQIIWSKKIIFGFGGTGPPPSPILVHPNFFLGNVRKLPRRVRKRPKTAPQG